MEDDHWPLKILATTDLHMSICGFDYIAEKPQANLGLMSLEKIIKEQREIAPCILLDNGDSLQSSPQGDFIATQFKINGVANNPMIEAMNLLQYDAASVGNHEFDYGLEYLTEVIPTANFPFLCANIRPINDPQHQWPKPSTMIERVLINQSGETKTVKIGLIGTTPQESVGWSWSILQGNATAKDMITAAKREAAHLKAQGADLIVLMAHSGLDANPRMKNHKGMVAKLAELTDIDAIIAGHDHQLHPSGADPLLTTNNGNNNFESDAIAHKPIVQPGCFGQCLGVIDLELGTKDGKISLISAQSQLLFPNAQNDEQETDIQNLPSLQKMHNDLLAQNAQKIAETNTALITYFEGALDSCALGLITKSQHEGATSLVKGTQFEGLPIVSYASPQRVGFGGDASKYTHIPPGPIFRRDLSSLYQYQDRLHGIVITKSELIEHLELVASIYSRISPAVHDQDLLDPAFTLHSHNRFSGVDYILDPTKPARYDADYKIIDNNAFRVSQLTLDGHEVGDNQRFLLVMNTFRAGGGGNIFNYSTADFVCQSEKTIQEMIVDHLSALNEPLCAFEPTATLVHIPETSATFKSSAKAGPLVSHYGRKDLEFVRNLEDGYALFRYRFCPPK
ncbi:MAG: 5'-nucleotidase C-terminal domain-containing protein [Paracoccaceae bacterium]|nr:5'-nucleotidase C-terminal domain-containing protein [Paracoccaceae bacterium]